MFTGLGSLGEASKSSQSGARYPRWRARVALVYLEILRVFQNEGTGSDHATLSDRDVGTDRRVDPDKGILPHFYVPTDDGGSYPTMVPNSGVKSDFTFGPDYYVMPNFDKWLDTSVLHN